MAKQQLELDKGVEGGAVMKEQHRTKGFTMVSVMVAFVILLIGISMLYASLSVSRNMIDTAKARLERNEEDLGKVYEYSEYRNPGSGTITWTSQNVKNPSFTIKGQLKKHTDTGFYFFQQGGAE